MSAITAVYGFSAAGELWYARDRDLLSRWPTLLLVAGHAGFLLARIPFAQALAASAASGQAQGAAVTAMAFEALFVVLCLPFLRVAMSKERAEFEQRKVALTDSLTGIAIAARSSSRRRSAIGPLSNVGRRRCCCSISIVSRRSTTRPGTRRETACCRPSAILSRHRSSRATCSAGCARRHPHLSLSDQGIERSAIVPRRAPARRPFRRPMSRWPGPTPRSIRHQMGQKGHVRHADARRSVGPGEDRARCRHAEVHRHQGNRELMVATSTTSRTARGSRKLPRPRALAARGAGPRPLARTDISWTSPTTCSR